MFNLYTHYIYIYNSTHILTQTYSCIPIYHLDTCVRFVTCTHFYINNLGDNSKLTNCCLRLPDVSIDLYWVN